MKLILEIKELEAIVKENIALKYPNQEINVSVQNKRNGVEVTVTLSDKLAEKEAISEDKVYVADDYNTAEEETLA